MELCELLCCNGLEESVKPETIEVLDEAAEKEGKSSNHNKNLGDNSDEYSTEPIRVSLSHEHSDQYINPHKLDNCRCAQSSCTEKYVTEEPTREISRGRKPVPTRVSSQDISEIYANVYAPECYSYSDLTSLEELTKGVIDKRESVAKTNRSKGVTRQLIKQKVFTDTGNGAGCSYENHPKAVGICGHCSSHYTEEKSPIGPLNMRIATNQPIRGSTQENFGHNSTCYNKKAADMAVKDCNEVNKNQNHNVFRNANISCIAQESRSFHSITSEETMKTVGKSVDKENKILCSKCSRRNQNHSLRLSTAEAIKVRVNKKESEKPTSVLRDNLTHAPDIKSMRSVTSKLRKKNRGRTETSMHYYRGSTCSSSSSSSLSKVSIKQPPEKSVGLDSMKESSDYRLVTLKKIKDASNNYNKIDASTLVTESAKRNKKSTGSYLQIPAVKRKSSRDTKIRCTNDSKQKLKHTVSTKTSTRPSIGPTVESVNILMVTTSMNTDKHCSCNCSSTAKISTPFINEESENLTSEEVRSKTTRNPSSKRYQYPFSKKDVSLQTSLVEYGSAYTENVEKIQKNGKVKSNNQEERTHKLPNPLPTCMKNKEKGSTPCCTEEDLKIIDEYFRNKENTKGSSKKFVSGEVTMKAICENETEATLPSITLDYSYLNYHFLTLDAETSIESLNEISKVKSSGTFESTSTKLLLSASTLDQCTMPTNSTTHIEVANEQIPQDVQENIINVSGPIWHSLTKVDSDLDEFDNIEKMSTSKKPYVRKESIRSSLASREPVSVFEEIVKDEKRKIHSNPSSLVSQKSHTHSIILDKLNRRKSSKLKEFLKGFVSSSDKSKPKSKPKKSIVIQEDSDDVFTESSSEASIIDDESKNIDARSSLRRSRSSYPNDKLNRHGVRNRQT